VNKVVRVCSLRSGGKGLPVEDILGEFYICRRVNFLLRKNLSFFENYMYYYYYYPKMTIKYIVCLHKQGGARGGRHSGMWKRKLEAVKFLRKRKHVQSLFIIVRFCTWCYGVSLNYA